METLANLDSFVRSAQAGSFSAAARLLALTPAAVSRNVAKLESNLGVRLFQRSTRRLTLTEEGERFLHAVSGGLDSIQAAIASVASSSQEPSGTLKLSMAPGFASDYALPLLPAFMQRYPHIRHDWHIDNRRVDLIAEGFDAAIAGGFDLVPGVVARELARIHIVAAVAPAYLATKKVPRTPEDVKDWDWLALRSTQQGRLRPRLLKQKRGREVEIQTPPRITFNDPIALTQATVLGLGLALLPLPNALPHLESGALVRVLNTWAWDAGALSLYYPGSKLLPARTRAFIDYLVTEFRSMGWSQRFSKLEGSVDVRDGKKL